jgi:cytochrome c oxidase subunit 2
VTALIPFVAQADLAPAPEFRQGSYFFPVQASTFARESDWLFYFIFWVCTVFFVGIVAAMVYFVIKYRRRPGVDPELSSSHNTPLEIAWSVLPSLLLILMFKWGADGYFDQQVSFDGAEVVRVRAQQFNWMFEYEDGDYSNELHLVQNHKYEFRLESADVLHSFFVPAFRQKQDIVPGRYTTTWLQPTMTGVFRLYCAEYCGDNHSLMKTNVTVHATEAERKDATKWDFPELAKTLEGRIANGKRLFTIKCAGCHSINGKRMTGPNLDGKWGTEEQLEVGGPVKFDDNYVRESILNPQAKIVRGFGPPNQKMQSFQGELNDDQLNWLIDFIKSIGPGESAADPNAPALTAQ